LKFLNIEVELCAAVETWNIWYWHVYSWRYSLGAFKSKL